MSLYLHPDVTPDTIREARAAGIRNVKSYPAGVTTNSAMGVIDYSVFYPVFEEMQTQDMILNLHGECPSQPPDHGDGITILNAESSFLPTLKELHRRFPRLRIILEHCSTADAVRVVKECGETVAATITAHHLSLTVDSWAGDANCFCKPVAKLPSDRDALVRAVVSRSPKFFFGSDSAPHPTTSKWSQGKVAAGVFTQPYATQLVLDALSEAIRRGVITAADVTIDCLTGFLSSFGRRFYKLDHPNLESIKLLPGQAAIARSVSNSDGTLTVIPFRPGEVTWGLEWAQECLKE